MKERGRSSPSTVRRETGELISTQTELSRPVGPQKGAQRPLRYGEYYWTDDENEQAYIFATDLPTRFLFVELFRHLVTLETNDNITLDSTKRANFGSSCGTRHGTDSDIKRRRRRGSTVIRELAVI